eukprot:Lankesteria_metandrocarpae@DN2608_c0_g1_i3.p1
MKQTVGQFLCRRLYEAGAQHIFGVPGDFVLGLMNNILTSDVKLICTCNELNAAYAADAYGRLRGIGACVTTYAVGELSAINGIAGAFAESVPVVKITGAPACSHFKNQTMLHHTLGDYSIPKKMYSLITGANVILNNTVTVVEEVDHVLGVCLRKSTPVYISVCTDLVEEEIDVPTTPFVRPVPDASDPNALEEAVTEAVELINNSKRPIVLPGLDILRANLQGPLRTLLEASGIPYATMMLGKAVLEESHPQFIGLYVGSRSRAYVIDRVHNADCLVVFGERMTDFNTGGFSADLDPKKTIRVERDEVQIKYATYHNVRMSHFIAEVTRRIKKFDPKELNIIPATQGCTHRKTREFESIDNKALTMSRTFDALSHFLPDNSILIAETGTSLFCATEVMLPKGATFMGQTFYGSIGYTIGACLGASIAAPDRPVVLFVGDGSFQVTCQDVSTMVRYGCKPLIFLVNNDGYLIERAIVDRSYNDVQPWKYTKFIDLIGGGTAYKCVNEGELSKVFNESKSRSGLIFAELILGKWDCNNALMAAGKQMALANRLLSKEEEAKVRLELKAVKKA